MRDSHLPVVDDVCEVIRRETIALAQYKVLDGHRGVVNWRVDEIMLREAFVARLRGTRRSVNAEKPKWSRGAHLEPDYTLLPFV